GLIQVAAHGVFVDHFDSLQVLERRTCKGVSDFGILHALEIPFYCLGIHLTAIVEQHPVPQFKSIAQQVWRRFPGCSDAWDWLGFLVEVKQSLIDSGQWHGYQVDRIAMQVES